MSFEAIDRFLTNFSTLIGNHPGLGLTLSICGIIAFIATMSSLEERAKKKRLQNERLAAPDDSEDAAPRTDGKRSDGRQRLSPLDRKHLDLLSGFVECSRAINDPDTAKVVAELAGATDLIFRRLKGRSQKKMTPDERRFINKDAPDTLTITREYVKLSQRATSEALKEELARTARALGEFRNGFEAYLAKFESGDATRIAILTETRRQIAAFTQPMALPAPTDLSTLSSGVASKQVHEKVLRNER